MNSTAQTNLLDVHFPSDDFLVVVNVNELIIGGRGDLHLSSVGQGVLGFLNLSSSQSFGVCSFGVVPQEYLGRGNFADVSRFQDVPVVGSVGLFFVGFIYRGFLGHILNADGVGLVF